MGIKNQKERIIKERILKNAINKYGYHFVYLSKNNNCKPYTIHRLVALAFIPNIENKKEVNHKNGIKSDNKVSNLEWCTCHENILHAYKIGLKKSAIPKVKMRKYAARVGAYHKNNKLFRVFDSILDAERKLNIKNSNIVACCKGRQKTAGGYIWKYIED